MQNQISAKSLFPEYMQVETQLYTTATMKASTYTMVKQNLVFYNANGSRAQYGNSGSCKCNSAGGNGRYRISAEIKAEYVVKRLLDLKLINYK